MPQRSPRDSFLVLFQAGGVSKPVQLHFHLSNKFFSANRCKYKTNKKPHLFTGKADAHRYECEAQQTVD